MLLGYLCSNTAAHLLHVRQRERRRKGNAKASETLPRKVADAEDILGKAHFPVPLHATSTRRKRKP